MNHRDPFLMARRHSAGYELSQILLGAVVIFLCMVALWWFAVLCLALGPAPSVAP